MKINFRPALVMALVLALGILAGFLSLIYSQSAAYFILAAAAAAILLGTAAALRRFLPPGFLIFVKWGFVSVAVMCVGFMLFFLSYAISGNKTDYDKNMQVAGTVSDRYTTKDGNYYFLLQDVTVIGDSEGQGLSGRVFVYINSEPDQNSPVAGQRVQFTAKLHLTGMLSGGRINSYALRNNISYNAYIAQEDIEVQEGLGGGALLSMRIWLRGQLLGNMRADNANIAYALIVGDSLHIDSGLKTIFTDSGIAHIFSVSGLHVGVLSAAVVFVMRRLRAGGKTILFVNVVLLFLYALLCGFVPSVTRSLIMIFIYLAAGAWGKKYDGISSVSVAVIIILLLNPLTLFDVGFLLSACAVYCIFLLQRPISRLLCRLKFLPRWLTSALSVTLAAQVGITPILCGYFGSLPMLAILLNLIAVPLVSVVYVALMAIVPLSALVPLAAVLYVPAQGLLEIVKFIVTALERTGLYVLGVRAMPAVAAICFYALIVCASDIVRFAKLAAKPAVCIALALVTAAVYGFSYRPFIPRHASFAAVYTSLGDYSVVTDEDGAAVIVCYGGTDTSFEDLRLFLYNNSIYNIEAAVSFKSDSSTVSLLRMLTQEYGLKYAALPDGGNSAYIVNNMTEIKVKLLLSGERYVYKNLRFAAYYYNADYYAGTAIAGNSVALYLMDTGDKAVSYLFEHMFFDVDILFSNKLSQLAMSHYRPAVYVCSERFAPVYAGMYSTELSGSLIFQIKGDNILRKYSYRVS